MKKAALFLLLSALWIDTGNSFASELPSVTHYSLRLQIFPSEHLFEAKTEMTITNNTNQVISDINFLLYRLLDVAAIYDDAELPPNFTQNVLKFSRIILFFFHPAPCKKIELL